ncbi:MAG: hypothetical protein KDA55_21905, partial [Planctomycetales bacterium]|nr:hypothetical protein [Planctomycetales bacterium]
AGQYGNVQIDDGQDESFVRMYDTDLDGIVDLSELPRVLTRNAGRARPFNLRSSNYYLENNRLNSPVRRLLDGNRDGNISAEEALAARAVLHGRDANEDGLITRDELREDRAAEEVPMLSRRISTNPDSAVALDNVENWTSVLYSLRERYEAGQPLFPDSFRFPATLFAQLDQDGDEKLSKTEVAELATLPEHLSVELRFGENDAPLVGEIWICDELREAGVTADLADDASRVVVQLGDARVDLFAVDAIDGNIRQRAEQQLAQLDTNQDGYIDKLEAPEDSPIGQAFSDYDADADGKIYPNELAAVIELQTSAAAGQIRSRVGFFADALFNVMDANGDGRLTSRELGDFPALVARLDRNGDGKLGVNEIPECMLVGLVRGDPQQDDNSLQPPRATLTVDESAPRWFKAMDRNRDNELSAPEFLGDSEQFQQLDANRDGYIDVSEARRESASSASK